MEECTPTVNTGLRGVTVASTRISDVNGAEGKLIYRGYLVKDLAEKATFEETTHLLLYEALPTDEQLAAFKSLLTSERSIPTALLEALKTRPVDAIPMDILQAGVAMLAHSDRDARQASQDAFMNMGIRLIAKMPVILAAWQRIRNGKEPVEPRTDLSHAGNFLYMMSGEVPDEELTHFFDVCLTLHAEHSFNASTFSARQVASTRAHMYSAIAAAVGSLSGELHGGANERVMGMLKKIDAPEAVDDYVNAELEAGRKIFGLGHAVYQTDDPRARILAPMSKKMGERTGQPRWYSVSKILEEKGKQVFKERKGIDIYVNVDFYSASLYYTMGIPIDFFTPVFAIARVAGWVAHVMEERFAQAAAKPALYRPKSDYVGDYCGPDECAYVPIDNR